jgi:hypothetical protein
MSEEQQEFVTGREGLFIPKVDTKELGPSEFLRFFRDTLAININEQESRDVNFHPEPNHLGEELVIPGSEDENSGLVYLRYRQGGHGKFPTSETFEVLTPPRELSCSFGSFLRIYNTIDLKILDITKSSGERLAFTSKWSPHGSSDPARIWLDRENEEVGEKDRKTLGSIATDFVKLVS